MKSLANYFGPKSAATVVVGLMSMLVRPANASGLVTGHYVFRAPYASVCLNGTYPITLGKITTDSTLTVVTDTTGQLTGLINLRGIKSNIAGTVTQGDGFTDLNSVYIQGQTTGSNPIGVSADLFAYLHGRQFLGDGEDEDGDVRFTMDVSAASPLIVTFDLNLSVDVQGHVTGTGTARSCALDVPVTVTGTNGTTCNLHIVGTNLPQFVWDGSGTPTNFGLVASWNAHGYGFTPTGSQLPIFAPNAPALVPYVTSRKNHLLPTPHIPAFASYDINLPTSGTPGVECRGGITLGAHQLVIRFPTNITLNPPNGTPAVEISSGIGRISAFAIDNNEVVVNLAGVANAQTIGVTLRGVSDGTNISDVVVPMTVLTGDTNGDGFVDAIDTSQVKSQSGRALTQSNFREDLNLDGFIDAIDTSLVKSLSGTAAVSPTPIPAPARPARNRYPSMKPRLLGRY